MKINNFEIEKGSYKKVKLRVGFLPSGTEINIFAHVFRAEQDGPTALLLAGVHGDEINGVETIRRVLDSEMLDKLVKGSVIVVPLLNVFGFINFSRDVPDGKDVNRSFPGNNKGSLAARVARKLTRSILPLVDFGIDFHTGGESRYNYPQVRYTKNDVEAFELAKVFDAPVSIARSKLPKSLRKVAGDMGIPIIVFEGGESKRLDGESIKSSIRGITNVLRQRGMLEGELEKNNNKVIAIQKTSWVRAAEAGLFVWSQSSGVYIRKGDELGVIKDVQGMKTIKVLARNDGFIIAHNNAPVVNAGDALFHIGHLAKEIK